MKSIKGIFQTLKLKSKMKSIAQLERELEIARAELDVMPIPQPKESKPNGAFFEYGSDEEREEYVKMEEVGWKGFINKIKNL